MSGSNDAIMEIGNVLHALEWQADHAAKNGAPATGRVIRAMIPLLDGPSRCAARMRSWPGLSLEDAMPLRFAGGLHNLFLTGRAQQLGAVYCGEATDQTAIDALVAQLTLAHDADLLTWFDGPPQTNEAGRSASVMAQLLWLAERLGPRFELLELGASAGINTMMDRFHFDLGGVELGDPASPMRIAPEWRGAPPPRTGVEISAIRGCDIAPIDLTDPAAALRLKSYVWAEVIQRLDRIDAAAALAAQRPPQVERADAGDWVERQLAVPQASGVTRVLFHTVVWQYVPAASRERIVQAMEQAGAAATKERPLAWVTVETNRQTFKHELRTRYWPGGAEPVLLGEAHAHGAWVDWRG